jgi:diguanylate cyclase (GGDEF)-like protein
VKTKLSVLTYAHFVSLAGLGALVAMIVFRGLWFPVNHAGTFAVLTAGVILSEMLPLKIPRRGDDEELTVSSAFAFALLLIGGGPAGLIAQALASGLQDLHARKPWWRTTFNIGQYCLSLGAAWLVMHSISGVPHIHEARPFSESELPVVLLGATVFFLANLGIVGSAIALSQEVSLRHYFINDWGFSAMTNGVLLCLAPMIVAAEKYSLMIIPLFAFPLMALYRAGQEGVRSEHAARHDALTGLPNRGRFQAVAEHTLEAHPDGPVAVLLMDLDRFKDVNDTLGHHHGDLLLKHVARRLTEAVPEAEAVARLGGDEFAVLLPPAAAAEVEAVVQRMSDALGPNIEVGEFIVDGEASIGVAIYPENGRDVETLLQRADVAMYRAKATHADWARYEEAYDHHSPAKLALMSDLRGAIDNGQILCHYQPVLDLRTGRVEGVEALVRWDHPDLGLLPPGAFLEMAEHTSLIKPLTLRVIDTSLRQLAEWQALGLDVTMSINVSVRSLLDPGFPAQVAEVLADVDISPRLVKLEITESTIMADPRVARRVLDELSAMGLTLSIDDFGTGYSSLAYLKDLPVHEVKIDRSFVMGMGKGGESDAVIVRSTIDLGHHLGLQVVGEGVEDEDTLERLRDLRCDRAQGFHISRPTAGRELTAWMLTRPVGGASSALDSADPVRSTGWEAA